MFYLRFFLISVFAVGLGTALSIPPYIKPCSLSDPNFDKCCLEHAREALPTILKGDRKYKIPNLVPLLLPSVTVDAGENLKIYLKNINAYGLENIDLQNVKIDVNKKKLRFNANIKELSLVGKYKVDGKILILPIQGNGDINITAVDGKYEYDCDYTLEEIDGEEHLTITDNDVLDFKLGKAIFKLDNLFNGDEALGKQMNTFLNDNWNEVVNEIGGAISQTVRSVVRVIATGMFSKISFRQLFLP